MSWQIHQPWTGIKLWQFQINSGQQYCRWQICTAINRIRDQHSGHDGNTVKWFDFFLNYFFLDFFSASISLFPWAEQWSTTDVVDRHSVTLVTTQGTTSTLNNTSPALCYCSVAWLERTAVRRRREDISACFLSLWFVLWALAGFSGKVGGKGSQRPSWYGTGQCLQMVSSERHKTGFFIYNKWLFGPVYI